MTSDKYLLLTCKHAPRKFIQIGSGRHMFSQWRCACGKIVPLTRLQTEYATQLVYLLIDREIIGPLSEEQEASMAGILNDLRNDMPKSEQDQLEAIVKAIVDSRSSKKAQAA
jgi:hypothetical protein